MWQAIHAKNNFDVHPSVGFKDVKEFVLLDDFIRDVAEVHADEFGAFKRGVEVRVRNIHGHEACPWSGNDTVEQNFGNKHVGSGGGNFARVVDVVATYHKVGAVMGSFFSGLMAQTNCPYVMS